MTFVCCFRNARSSPNDGATATARAGGTSSDAIDVSRNSALSHARATDGSYCESGRPAVDSKQERAGPRSGTCASSAYEPRQGRKAAALSTPCAVPQALRIAVGPVCFSSSERRRSSHSPGSAAPPRTLGNKPAPLDVLQERRYLVDNLQDGRLEAP